MSTVESQAGKRILDRTLKAVRLRHDRRGKRLAFFKTLGLTALAGVGLGLLVKPGEQPRPVLHLPEVPALVIEMEEIPLVWQEASILVLVVNGEGMEMKALNDAQVAALARKPGCEFGLTPDAVMWASECGIGGDGFSPGGEF